MTRRATEGTGRLAGLGGWRDSGADGTGGLAGLGGWRNWEDWRDWEADGTGTGSGAGRTGKTLPGGAALVVSLLILTDADPSG